MATALPICFATNNLGKLKEIQQFLGNDFALKSLADIGCTEDIPETGTTIEENSKLKAQYVSEKYGIDCFADDTGLEVASLNNEPGVYSARYAGTGVAEDNMNLLLKNLAPHTSRTARFKTIVTLAVKGQYYSFEGLAEGNIIEQKRGSSGFGYDPIFVPVGYHLTFAELSMEEKNSISHRGKAMRLLISFLQNHKF